MCAMTIQVSLSEKWREQLCFLASVDPSATEKEKGGGGLGGGQGGGVCKCLKVLLLLQCV